MPSEREEKDDLLAGIYQEITPVLTGRVAKEFKAWHKPRKQYIRIKQWCAEVRKLIKANKLAGGDILRYLGFPGEDFLDVRTLHGVCAPEKIVVRYLGFDSTAQVSGEEFEFNLSQHEIFQLGHIHEHSRVLKARIEQVANEKSLAYKYTSDCRHFDVINIDLCDAVTTLSKQERNLYFDALLKLAAIQVRGRTQPWLLFLTTRVIRDQLDRDTKRKLFDCVIQNVDQHADFRERLDEEMNLDAGAIRAEIDDLTPLAHSSLVQLFALSLGKWFLRAMMRGSPQLMVRLLDSYSYRVQIDEPDMLSLAFWFEPIITPPADSSGLTAAAAEKAPSPSEVQLATDLIQAILGIQDIDQKLAEDDRLFEQMVKKSRALLETVRYDVSGYEAWASKERWKPPPSS